jgi:hypothetical protein
MGNTYSQNSQIQAKIVFPNDINLKFLKSYSMGGESFYYFKPMKNAEIGNLQIQIVNQNKYILDDVQLYQFNFEKYDSQDYRNGEEFYLQYSKEMDNCSVIFRTDNRFIIKQIVYKIKNKFIK